MPVNSQKPENIKIWKKSILCIHVIKSLKGRHRNLPKMPFSAIA